MASFEQMLMEAQAEEDSKSSFEQMLAEEEAGIAAQEAKIADLQGMRDDLKGDATKSKGTTWKIGTEDYNLDTGLEMGDTTYRTLAGIGSGMVNVAQQAGNVVGLVDDETILERKREEAELNDTTAGSVGQFVGETVALAPLGLVAKPMQGAHALAKTAPVLSGTMQALTGKAATAALQGAAAGTLLSNPNERGTGALIGGLTGGTLSKAGDVASRVMKDGLVKVSPDAKRLKELVKRSTGKDTFIPLGQLADPDGGSLSNIAKSLHLATTLFPGVNASVRKQSADALTDVYETNLRQTMGRVGSKAGDASVKSLKESGGDVLRAIDDGLFVKPSQNLSPLQQTLQGLSKTKLEGRYRPTDLATAVQKSAGGYPSYAPLRETSTVAGKVLNRAATASDVFTRDIYQSIDAAVSKGVSLSPINQSMLGSKGFQNFLTGNLEAQKSLRVALQTGSGKALDGVLSAIRIAMSGGMAADEGSVDMANTYQDKAGALANQLRSNF